MPRKKQLKSVSSSKFPQTTSDSQHVSNAVKKKIVQTKPNSYFPTKEKASYSKEERIQINNSQVPNNVEHQKYHLRNLESNWARYKEEPVVKSNIISDSDLKNTGADFASLISQSGTSKSVFRFKNEAEWDSDSHKESQISYDAEEDTVSSVNLERVAKCLTAIPMFEKLKLSNTLDTLKCNEFGWCGDYLENKMTENIDEHIIECKNEDATLENSAPSGWCFKGIEKYERSVLNCVMKTKKESVASSCTGEDINNCLYAEQISDCKEDAIFRTRNENAENLNHETFNADTSNNPVSQVDKTDKDSLSNESSDEDELDVLLSMSSQQYDKDCENDKTTNEDAKREKNMSQNKTMDSKYSVQEREKDTTDDLDDWLDSILE